MAIHALIDLLRNDGCITINKKLIKNIGLHEAILYSELVSRYAYFADRKMLDKSGYFFNTAKDLMDGTSLTKKQQSPAIKRLVALGLIKAKVTGVPAKRYFKIVNDPALVLRCLGSKDYVSELEHDAITVAFAQYIGRPIEEIPPEVLEEARQLAAKAPDKAKVVSQASTVYDFQHAHRAEQGNE